MARLSEVLKKRDFFLLWLAQIISQFGDKLAQMALVGLVWERGPGSAYELAKLFLFVIVPVFVIGPIAGAYSDRWDRRYTMVVSDFIRGLLVLLIALYFAVVPSLKPIFPVYIVVFIIFSIARFFIPAKMAIIPDLVAHDKLAEANSLIHTTGMIATALGYGIGGIIVSLSIIGVKGGLIIDALTFFISASLIFFIKKTAVYTCPPAKESLYEISQQVKELVVKSATSIFAEIKEGLMYIFSLRKMHFVIALLFLVWSGIGATTVILVPFIQNTFASITRDLGLLIMIFGSGLFCGSIIYGKLSHKISKARAIFLSLILSGILLIQFVVFLKIYQSFLIAAAVAFLFGGAVSPIIISSNAIVHEIVHDNMRGRAFSSLEAVMHLAFLIFMFVGSISAEFIESFYILFAVGAIFVSFGIWGIKKLNKKEVLI